MTRQQKSERQRAEEALALAHRKRDRLLNDVANLRGDLKRRETQLEAAEQILTYRRQHPALQSTTPTTTQENA